MKRSIRLFLAVLRSQIQDALAYPGMLVIWMFHLFFFPLIMLMIWQSAAGQNPAVATQWQSLVNYYIVLPLFGLITSAWQAPFFAEKIRRGGLNMYLVKPVTPFIFDVTNNISEKLVKSVYLLPMVFVGMWLYPVHVALGWQSLAVVGGALILGAMIKFLTDAVVGVAGFWFDEVSSLINWTDAAEYTLGGRLVPIFMFPVGLAGLARLLPFYYFAAFPLEILSGTITPPQIIQGYGVAFMWVAALTLVTYLGWRKGVQKYSAFGG